MRLQIRTERHLHASRCPKLQLCWDWGGPTTCGIGIESPVRCLCPDGLLNALGKVQHDRKALVHLLEAFHAVWLVGVVAISTLAVACAVNLTRLA